MRRLLALTLAAAALLAAACGSSNKPPASASGSQQQNGVQAAYKYATCMRQHGVSNFPDPKVSGGNGSQSIRLAVPAGVGSSPSFKSAQSACNGILPAPQNSTPAQRHAHVAGLVSFANCMRAHGLTSFPDPNSQGQIRPETLSAAGVDIHSPAFIKAAYACVSSSQGQLTRGQIAQAESGG